MTDLTTLKYTAEHEWLRLEGDEAVIGITDYAADKLGDVVFLELFCDADLLEWNLRTVKALPRISKRGDLRLRPN